MSSKMRKISALDLSELPDEIIANILSRLTLKQAASTSVVSTRWKDLWKLYSGCFDFDGFETPLPSNRKSTRKLVTETNQFVDWVDHVLRSHRGATIEGLRIIFNLKKPSYHAIDNWIQLALVKSVKFIELDLTGFHYTTPYNFPIHGFRSLKTLHLTRVDISGDALQSLLDNSPNLEELNIAFSVSLILLKLSSLSLKNLTLWSCGRHYFSDVKISAPNLLLFTWAPLTRAELVLEDVPKLKYMELSGTWPRIGRHYSQLQELVLSIPTECGCEDENGINIDVPELSNLTHLTLTLTALDGHTFSHFVDCLNVAPLLEKITIKLRGAKKGVVKLTQAMLTNNHYYRNLKTVTFKGFGATNDVEFIRYLLGHAPLLDKITIDACRPHYLGTREERKYRQTRTYLEARDCAINLSASLSCHLTVV